MYATLTFDTEDVYFPPQFRIDDIPGWLAEIMTEVGIRGTFCVFGEKAASMKKRGREDVLSKMARHSLVSHQQGNVHPLIPEILQNKGWADGVEAMRRYEDQVNEDFVRAFGREAAGLSRHNAYWAAQHVAVAGERAIPYADGAVGIPHSEQPVWYAGALHLPSHCTPTFDDFDRIYSCDHAFEQHLQKLDEFLAGCLQRGVECVEIFGCHPVQVMARGWIEEYCLANGLTRTPKELGWLYGVKSPEEEAIAKTNFRRLCQYLKNHPGLQIVGIEEAARLFSTQPPRISRDELSAYAEAVERAGQVVLHETFSPAEMACGMAESLAHAEAHGDIPIAIDRRNVLGPTSPPIVGPEAYSITHDELVSLCRQTVEFVSSQKHLPANVTMPNARVGLGQLAVLLARAYRAEARCERYERLRVPLKVARYPAIAMEVDARMQAWLGEHWPFPPEFSCEKIAEHARLQTWTLKPAWLRPPRGASLPEGRIPFPAGD